MHRSEFVPSFDERMLINASELSVLPREPEFYYFDSFCAIFTQLFSFLFFPVVKDIDYSKFYKLDKEKIQSANNFKGDLYLIALEDEYKVISIEGEEYKNDKIYILIPLNDIADPEYIAVANNTYKLYGDGTIKVVGELTSNSGMTADENEKEEKIRELDIEQIAEGTEMKIDKNIETNDEIAKKYGVKKIYISCNTAYIIDAENNLWAWGENQYNKLGQGNSYLVTTPIKI